MNSIAKKKRKPHNKWLWLIAVGKLFYGLLLIATGVAALNLVGKNLAASILHLINHWGLNYHSYYIRWLLHEVSNVDTEQLMLLSIGSFFYAILSFIEGGGLMVQKMWAHWLAIGDTGSFIPIEIYQLCDEFSWIKMMILLINTGTVIYLIWQVKVSKQELKAR